MFAFAVFAAGIIGTGLLAVPVLAGSAAYALGEAFGWPIGLARLPLEAKAFYGTIAVATLVGVVDQLRRHRSDQGAVLERRHQRRRRGAADGRHDADDHAADGDGRVHPATAALGDGLAVHRHDGGLGHDHVRDVVREVLGMGFKDILVHVDSTPASAVRLRLSISLARRFGARLSGLHVTPDPDVPPYFKPSAVARIAKLYRQSAREAAVLAEAHFREATKDLDVDAVWQSIEGDIAGVLAERARFSDLLVLGQYDTENPPTIAAFTTPEKVVVDAGTPILVVPTRGSFDDLGRHVLLAWDGSRESARAIRDAMPLLRSAERLSLVAVNPDRQGHMHPNANPAELVAHLARHGVSVKPIEIFIDEKIVTDILLLVQAAELRADLLVMGAYGHPPLWEFWLGGTTQALLERAPIPILMSH